VRKANSAALIWCGLKSTRALPIEGEMAFTPPCPVIMKQPVHQYDEEEGRGNGTTCEQEMPL
jgi:hypothetical protein